MVPYIKAAWLETRESFSWRQFRRSLGWVFGGLFIYVLLPCILLTAVLALLIWPDFTDTVNAVASLSYTAQLYLLPVLLLQVTITLLFGWPLGWFGATLAYASFACVTTLSLWAFFPREFNFVGEPPAQMIGEIIGSQPARLIVLPLFVFCFIGGCSFAIIVPRERPRYDRLSYVKDKAVVWLEAFDEQVVRRAQLNGNPASA